MSHEAATQTIIEYARSIRLDRRANPSVAGDGTALELLLAPRFQALIETLLAQRLPLAPRVLPEYRRGGIGRPDLAFAREAQPARAFIELKQPSTSLQPNRLRGHDADQFRRFSGLPLWAFCNFHRVHLYWRGELKEEAIVLPAIALDPGTSDTQADRLIRRHDPEPFLAILDALALASPMALRDAREIAEALAHAARLTRQIVRDQCRVGVPPVLADVRAEFRETLFAHAAAGGYDTSDEDDLFANAFAQTLAFGLLLAREAGGREVNRDAYRALPGGSYPLLRATLRALTQDEILELLGAGFDVLLDTVNVVNPDLLAARAGTDPILYFYEDFLGVFDPEAKKRHGVFFTPVPIVRFMVAATDRALKNALETQGLLDPSVLLLDPACGTGTFLIAAANLVADAARELMGDGAVAGEVAALATRLNGFELLVGPYTVAHYRLLREVAAHHVVPARRLPIYLADTLTPPAGALGVTSHLGFMAAPIVEERRGADRLKRDTPIIAIFGNPPYRRLSEGEEQAITAGWDNGFWDDLKAPVRNAGWGGELNTFPDLYVAFWRWSLWKLFESEGCLRRGVVCLITNRTFLAGHPYAGLRQMLRRRFDTIDIIDLRGDSRGARPASIETDENVFAIQAGVCILIAVATGNVRSAGSEANVRYADVWRHDAFTAHDKQMLLDAARSDDRALTFAQISRRGLDDFLPVPFDGLDWPALPEVFLFKKSGSKSQRDDLVYGFSVKRVMTAIHDFANTSDADASKLFSPRSEQPNSTERRQSRGELARFGRARAETPDESRVVEYVYRPFDRRYLYVSPNFVSRYGPDLIGAWGTSNVAIYAMPSGTGKGPAIWVHSLLPDYHSFRGSYGGYAFPLWDRRHGIDACNLNPALLDGLSGVYGRPVTPQAAFDAIAALLSGTSYTRRFGWDLEETFAHIPFPAGVSVFSEASRVGRAIRELETFGRAPSSDFHSARLAGRATGVTLSVPPVDRAFLADGRGTGAVALQEDQSLRLVSLPERVWQFAVSGYRVLPRWLAARNGEALDADLHRALLDVAWRIEELLHWFDAADQVLARAVEASLSRADLGLAAAGTPRVREVEEADDEPSDSTG
jgi:hypothetical protein